MAMFEIWKTIEDRKFKKEETSGPELNAPPGQHRSHHCSTPTSEFGLIWITCRKPQHPQHPHHSPWKSKCSQPLLESIQTLVQQQAQARPTSSVLTLSDKLYPTFDVDKPEEWERWLMALELAFSEQTVTEDSQRKRVLLHNNGDSRLFNLACDIFKSEAKEINEATFDEITDTLDQHFSPKVSLAAAYAQFTAIRQQTGETTIAYVSRLRRAAAKCEFGDATQNILKWQFMCGLANPVIQQYLLNAESKVTFQQALSKATTAECTQDHVRTISGHTTEYAAQAPAALPQINAAYAHHGQQKSQQHQQKSGTPQQSVQQQGNASRGCYKCAGPHNARSCPVDPATLYCTSCNTPRHNAAACRGKKGKKQEQRQSTSTAHAHTVAIPPPQQHVPYHPYPMYYYAQPPPPLQQQQPPATPVTQQQPPAAPAGGQAQASQASTSQLTAAHPLPHLAGQQGQCAPPPLPAGAPAQHAPSAPSADHQLFFGNGFHPHQAQEATTDAHGYPLHAAALFCLADANNLLQQQPPRYPLERFAGECHPTSLRPSQPNIISIQLDSTPCTMEVDNGATYTVMTSGTYDRCYPPTTPGHRPELQPVDILMKPYLDAPPAPALGARPVRVQYKDKDTMLPLLVVEGSPTVNTLLGRNWFTALGFSIAGLHQFSPSMPPDIQLHPALNQDQSELGCYRGPPIRLEWDKAAAPKYLPARPVPYATEDKLLHLDTPWTWTETHQAAVDFVKTTLLSDQVLDFYDPKKPLSMAVDASDYGVAAILAHTYPDGSERPICFASRTLTPAERRYDTFN
ncbi:hypothetical protein FOCC_FOCC017832 [Frankliniella occidentalis]|nr:hypothetical protein FOCC_FOCC017832 [Frankliniella occidentalis]